MTSPRRPRTQSPRGRRSSTRSTRRVAAGALLTLSLAAVVVALVAGSPWVVPAMVAVVVAVAAAAALLTDETAQVRRDWARDRAVRAHQTTRETTVRAREHVAFADHMTRSVEAARTEVERLLTELTVAAAAVQAAEAAAAEATRRGDRLESELASVRASLETTRRELRTAQDALADSQAAELAARSELTAWQQRDASRKYA